MTQLHELLPNLYAFNVPMGASNIFVYGTVHRPGIMYNVPKVYGAIMIEIRPGNWSIICCSATATEADAAKVVEKGEIIGRFYYMDYVTKRPFYYCSTNSLKSLLRSKGLDPARNWLILKQQNNL